MLELLPLELRYLLEHFAIPAVLSFFACIVRICLWGWHGFRHILACYCVGLFSGVCASWFMDSYNLPSTTEALIISLASLIGYDTLKVIFSRYVVTRVGRALGDRIAHEIMPHGENPQGARMNLHEAMLAELDSVFLNLDEFACVHDFNGRQVKCVVSDQNGLIQGATASGLVNVAGLGLGQCDRVVLCQACDLVPQPLPGAQITMDGQAWLVGEGEVVECEGLLTIPLKRAF